MADSGDGMAGLAGPGGGGPVILDGMRVLRLCSVFEPAALSGRSAWLRLAGGPAERRALAAADMVIALTPAAADRV